LLAVRTGLNLIGASCYLLKNYPDFKPFAQKLPFCQDRVRIRPYDSPIINPEIIMKSLIAIFLLSAGIAHAQCTTFGGYTSCQNGTTYQQFGNTTYGQNANTGNNWTQTQIGNTTFGSDSQGRTWTQTQQGNSTYGTDSKGRSYFCSKIGNQTICN
jgi:hypothetical protein